MKEKIAAAMRDHQKQVLIPGISGKTVKNICFTHRPVASRSFPETGKNTRCL